MTSDAKIQPAITGRARKAVTFDFPRYGHALHGHALRPTLTLTLTLTLGLTLTLTLANPNPETAYDKKW